MGWKIGLSNFVKFGPYVNPTYTREIVITGENTLDYFEIPYFHLTWKKSSLSWWR
jgi:hypothetical protein